MNNVHCPYCACPVVVRGELDPDEIHQMKCIRCLHMFTYTTSIIVLIEAEQAPCLNGDPHKLKPINRFPKEFAVGRMICEWCGEEVVVDREASEKAIEEYKTNIEKLISKGLAKIK